MEHHNPLLTNLKSDHKFITIDEIMLRLTPPNYQKIRMANDFEATYGGSEANIALALVVNQCILIAPGNVHFFIRKGEAR